MIQHATSAISINGSLGRWLPIRKCNPLFLQLFILVVDDSLHCMMEVATLEKLLDLVGPTDLLSILHCIACRRHSHPLHNLDTATEHDQTDPISFRTPLGTKNQLQNFDSWYRSKTTGSARISCYTRLQSLSIPCHLSRNPAPYQISSL